MLKLNTNDITLSQSASDKFEAIRNIAHSLTEKDLVEQGYVEGMIDREYQSSTFLGNGIAIPHGTIETRRMVKTTGVAIHHFPEGIEWGEGNTVYVAIGIAAKSDEHLGILRNLTKVLSSDGVEEHLRHAKSAEDIIALLRGNVQLDVDLDASLIQLLFPVSSMVQMSAVAGGLIRNTGCAGSEFVADLVTKEPTHLGKGLWLVGSSKQVTRTAVSFVSTTYDCECKGEKVSGLVAIAACNNAHQRIIKSLSRIVFAGEQERLLDSNVEEVIGLLKGEQALTTQMTNSDNIAVFKINNAHGLHARPSAMLVAEAKKFQSSIRVSNLDGSAQAVSAKSLMKVISLGVKRGHSLQFTADGVDAPQALQSIGQAIASGLGEG